MFKHGFPPEWSTLKKLIWLVGSGIVGGASAIWKTVTGTLIHITDALASPVKELSVAIEPLQSGSGDPSPTNVRPITGWTGCNVNRAKRNLLNPIIYDGGVYQPTVGSTLNLTKSATQFSTTDNETFTVTTSETWQYYTLLFPIPENGRNYYIYIKYTSSGQFGRSAGYLDADKKVLSVVNTTKTGTWTGEMRSDETAAPASYFYMVLTNRGTASATITVKNPIITRYEDDHTYEPYSGTTYPISWQTEAGTVYGGTLDVTTGVLTVLNVNLVCDSSKFTDLSNVTTQDGIQRFVVKYPLPYTGTTDSSGINYRACNVLPYKTGWNNFEAHIYVDTQFAVFLPTSYATISNKNLTAWKNWLNSLSEPLQVVYPLATPLTYQLTPQEVSTLAGENNIWTDVNGEITLTYKSNGMDSDKADTGKADFMKLLS